MILKDLLTISELKKLIDKKKGSSFEETLSYLWGLANVYGDIARGRINNVHTEIYSISSYNCKDYKYMTSASKTKSWIAIGNRGGDKILLTFNK